jgi:hypothetical protein
MRPTIPQHILKLSNGIVLLVFLLTRLTFASDTGQLYAGMYPDDFWRNTEILNSLAAWAGKPMTFGGTFLDASEDSSNIMEKLELLDVSTYRDENDWFYAWTYSRSQP